MQDTTAQLEDAAPTFEFNYKLGAREWKFNREDIVAFHASQKYVEVVLRNNPIRPIWDESLKILMDDDRFKDDFIYVHRATLVRTNAVVSADRAPASAIYSVTMNAGTGEPNAGPYRFVVSRRYYSPLRRMVAARPALTATA